ncbi:MULTISPECIES: poly-gamma-glutamate hydrolase family protein [Haloferax]|uniref:Phage-related replication protein n=1 Tax=Haloferax marinum TaxID=2666143 RepID=A0A6A8GDR0_9EURY|nr:MULTISPECIES: poly-gamma-glutamate hydrolase family protein [Haloferax]KAB1190737.1 hypothetical protein Hfx1150_17035 [Haloferax sp. CBA1150]MRW98273.1 hypothetical protein [Haloferax marinum]
MDNPLVEFRLLTNKKKSKFVYVSPELFDCLPAEIGEQIRVRLIKDHPTATETLRTDQSMFTLAGVREVSESSKILWIPPNHHRNLKRYCGNKATTYSNAEIECLGPHPQIQTPEKAAECEEFIEQCHINKEDRNEILITAPHGGVIEKGTSKQAEVFIDKSGFDTWITYGFGSAFPRWHISTNDIDPRSFPELSAVQQQDYRYVVSLHGHIYNSISVGGLADDHIKRQVKTAIEECVSEHNLDTEVELYQETDSLNGMSQENLVNWLSRNGGIHIEQPKWIRAEFPEVVTNALLNVFSR